MQVLTTPPALTKKEFVTSKIELLKIMLNLYKYFMKHSECFSLDISEEIEETGYALDKIRLRLETTDAYLRENNELHSS